LDIGPEGYAPPHPNNPFRFLAHERVENDPFCTVEGDIVSEWMREVSEGVEVDVWVVPGASRDSIDGPHGDALKVRVTAPADKGRANQAVSDLLAAHFAAPVTLLRGETSRRKTFLVRGAVHL
jgi:uncharacterized protein